VVRLHSGNGPHDEIDHRAIGCFDLALDDVEADREVRRVLHDYFAWATTTTMSRYPRSPDDVPEGLRIPRWSWDGLVSEPAPDDR
jgi:hemoglobin